MFRGNLGSNPSTGGNRDLQPNTNSGCVGPIRPDVFESWEPTIWNFTEICKSFTNLLPPPTKPQTLREVVSVPPKIYRLKRKFYWEKHERPNIFLFCLIHVANPVLPWLTSGAQEFMTTFIVLFEPKASINSDRYGWYLKWIQSCLISAVTAFFNYDLWSDKTSRRDPLRTPYLNIKTTGDFLSQKNTQISCTICIDSVIWIKWGILRAS